MPRLAEHSECTGCMACYNACQKQAIDVIKDKEGFLQPQVNAESCIECGLCEKSCPVVTPLEPWEDVTPKVYAAWHEEDRRESSSGGAFSAFARKTIEEGGVVFGAAFDTDFHLRHIEVIKVEGLKALRGSKYVQSEIGDTFRSVKKYLKENRKVMFCGTPCQVAGLRGYLRKQYENLLTADLACHGVPSKAIFHSYLNKLEKRLGKAEKCIRIVNYEFRRRDGWGKTPSISTMSNSTPPLINYTLIVWS